jgi:D-galactarolactone cycloisomerase
MDGSRFGGVKIRSVAAIPVRLPRDRAGAQGLAGSPTALLGAGDYQWSASFPTLYSVNFETTLVRVELEDGRVGWGEAQAPLAPEVSAEIVRLLLRPVLEGQHFDGTRACIEALWQSMYNTMRVRGQTGGFMLDAISGVDIALWDLAAQMAELPLAKLLAATAREKVPAYHSGLPGADRAQRLAHAEAARAAGFTLFKLYLDADWRELLRLAGELRRQSEVAIDALWHLPASDLASVGREVDSLGLRWLECPFMPEDLQAHEELKAVLRTPIALGESYRTVHELQPFLERRIPGILQPDLGRSGITESLRIAELGLPIVPHVSIALGPQLAAAVHLAAALPQCPVLEFNPTVLATANRLLVQPLQMEQGQYLVPSAPGLGVVPQGFGNAAA